MKIQDANWMQVEDYLKRDDRAILPLGSTEQHGYLSLLVDAILPERLALEAAEPAGVPVFPVLPFGVSPYFLGYPGTIALRLDTYLRVVIDVLDSLAGAGFKRILIINGHGGNTPASARAIEWMAQHPGMRVKWHNWWNAPDTWAEVQRIDPVASHASWMENFPWTRLPGVKLPADSKTPIDRDRMMLMNPAEVRAYLGDGNFAGLYQRPDEDMLAIWNTAVTETRRLLEGPWS
jgi:creatinine amidohydrolase